MNRHPLFAGPITVVNIGLELFATTLKDEGVTVICLDWRPPAGGDLRAIRLLERLQELETDGTD